MKTPIRHRVYLWMNAWCSLADGLLGIVTFSFYIPNFAMKHLLWHTKGVLKDTIGTGD